MSMSLHNPPVPLTLEHLEKLHQQQRDYERSLRGHTGDYNSEASARSPDWEKKEERGGRVSTSDEERCNSCQQWIKRKNGRLKGGYPDPTQVHLPIQLRRRVCSECAKFQSHSASAFRNSESKKRYNLNREDITSSSQEILRRLESSFSWIIDELTLEKLPSGWSVHRDQNGPIYTHDPSGETTRTFLGSRALVESMAILAKSLNAVKTENELIHVARTIEDEKSGWEGPFFFKHQGMCYFHRTTGEMRVGDQMEFLSYESRLLQRLRLRYKHMRLCSCFTADDAVTTIARFWRLRALMSSKKADIVEENDDDDVMEHHHGRLMKERMKNEGQMRGNHEKLHHEEREEEGSPKPSHRTVRFKDIRAPRHNITEHRSYFVRARESYLKKMEEELNGKEDSPSHGTVSAAGRPCIEILGPNSTLAVPRARSPDGAPSPRGGPYDEATEIMNKELIANPPEVDAIFEQIGRQTRLEMLNIGMVSIKIIRVQRHWRRNRVQKDIRQKELAHAEELREENTIRIFNKCVEKVKKISAETDLIQRWRTRAERKCAEEGPYRGGVARSRKARRIASDTRDADSPEDEELGETTTAIHYEAGKARQLSKEDDLATDPISEELDKEEHISRVGDTSSRDTDGSEIPDILLPEASDQEPSGSPDGPEETSNTVLRSLGTRTPSTAHEPDESEEVAYGEHGARGNVISAYGEHIPLSLESEKDDVGGCRKSPSRHLIAGKKFGPGSLFQAKRPSTLSQLTGDSSLSPNESPTMPNTRVSRMSPNKNCRDTEEGEEQEDNNNTTDGEYHNQMLIAAPYTSKNELEDYLGPSLSINLPKLARVQSLPMGEYQLMKKMKLGEFPLGHPKLVKDGKARARAGNGEDMVKDGKQQFHGGEDVVSPVIENSMQRIFTKRFKLSLQTQKKRMFKDNVFLPQSNCAIERPRVRSERIDNCPFARG